MHNILILLSLTACLCAVCPLDAGAQGTEDTARRYDPAQYPDLKGEIQLSGAFALYPMVVRWAEEFRKLHPEVRIDISAGGAGKGITDALARVVDLGMVSRDVYPQELEKGALPIAVAKDAVIPTVNAENPLIAQLLETGLTLEAAKRLWLELGDGEHHSGACLYPFGCLRGGGDLRFVAGREAGGFGGDCRVRRPRSDFRRAAGQGGHRL